MMHKVNITDESEVAYHIKMVGW